MTDVLDLVEDLNHTLDTREAVVRGSLDRYAGQTAFAFLTVDERAKLAHRIKSLSVNFGALAIDLLSERLRLVGFTVNGSPDLDLWNRWVDLGMDDGAQQVHREALAAGQSFASVWADESGAPTILPESATQCIVRRDPLSRRAVAGLKRWRSDNKAHAVLYLPTEVRLLTSTSSVPEGGFIPPAGWTVTSTVINPLGIVPLIDVTNPGTLTEPYGKSELAPLRDLTDALEKVMLDALIASHETGTARRWVTGAISVDPVTGEGLDPWADDVATMQVAAPDAKIGQLQAADLGGFDTLAGLLVRQIGALSGLSPQALGLHADSAMSADAIRAAEASLVSKAEARQRSFGRAWTQAAALMVAIRDGSDPRRVDVHPIWADPATRSEAQAADAATKLHAEGLLSREATLERLGYTPAQIAAESRRAATETALRAVMA